MVSLAEGMELMEHFFGDIDRVHPGRSEIQENEQCRAGWRQGSGEGIDGG